MENQERYGKGSIIVIIILTILVIGLAGYIGYDKFLNTNNEVNKENSKNECDNKDVDKKNEENKNNEKLDENKNEYIKTRICTGIYSGKVAVLGDISTGKYEMGTLTIELKADGTYNLTKEKVNEVPDTGKYTIIDNALLLETTGHICDPDDDCTNYTEFLDISEDCSKISGRYGDYFLDSNFTLNKQK